MKSKSETWAGHGQRISALQLLFNLWLTNNPNNQPDQTNSIIVIPLLGTQQQIYYPNWVGTTIEFWLSSDCKPAWCVNI